MLPLQQKTLQTPAEGNGRFPSISSLLKRSEVSLHVYNGVTQPHRVHDGAWVISFSRAVHLHIHTRSSMMHIHPVSTSTQDKYGNENVNKQKWNHIAPWERKHYRTITSVAMREGWREVVGCIYSLLIHSHPSSGDGSLLWSSASHRCVLFAHKIMVVTRQIRNRLQEERKFDWNVTLIHRIWSFPVGLLLTLAWGRRTGELFCLTSAGMHLLSNITISRTEV